MPRITPIYAWLSEFPYSFRRRESNIWCLKGMRDKHTKSGIDEATFARHLYTHKMLDSDLFIRCGRVNRRS